MELWAEVACAKVEDEGNVTSVTRGMANVYTNTRSGFPFGGAETRMVGILENICRTTPCVMIRSVGRFKDSTECFLWGETVGVQFNSVVFLDRRLKSKGPEDCLDGRWPLAFCMEEEGSRCVAC